MSTTMEEDKRIATIADGDTASAAEEGKKMKNEFDFELLKVSPADAKNLSLEQRRYWLYAHFLFRRNETAFKVKGLLTEDQLASLRQEEKEREEEEKEPNEEESSKLPKIDEVGGSGPRGVYLARSKPTAV